MTLRGTKLSLAPFKYATANNANTPAADTILRARDDDDDGTTPPHIGWVKIYGKHGDVTIEAKITPHRTL